MNVAVNQRPVQIIVIVGGNKGEPMEKSFEGINYPVEDYQYYLEHLKGILW